MESIEQVLLRFNGVDIFRVNFYSFTQFSQQKKINIDVNAKVHYPKDDLNTFNIIMSVALDVKEVFHLELEAIGKFEFEPKESSSEIRKKFVNVNAPAIMFPYIRSFISTFTANLGDVTGTLNIPTRFFKGELEEYKVDEEFLGE